MLQRVFPAVFVLFLLPAMMLAQSQADSVGTIHVRKKPADPSVEALRKEPPVYMIVEEMPSFPRDGMTMTEFIDAAFVVPQQAIDRGISGTVMVSCIVGEDGELKNIKIAKGVPNCPDCNAEALRVVNQMPVWIPGRQNGRAVPVMLNIPVRFRFKK